MTAGIYKLTSPSGKCYIGQSVNIENRILAYARCDCDGQPKIYRAIKKYGWDDFKFEYLHIIDSNLDNRKEILNELEIKYIKEYDSINNGYNIQHGGMGGLHSEETKLKMSKTRKGVPQPKESVRKRLEKVIGRKHTDEAKAKISAGLSKQTQEMKDKRAKSQIGRIASEETRLKMSKMRKNDPKTAQNIREMNKRRRKPILQFDLNNNLVKEWNSIEELMKGFDISQHYINLCCKNKKENHNGFIWRFKEK